ERSRQYQRLRGGTLRVAIGARSAVFAPVKDLGIIIVDECHETSYKQEASPRYHGRDVAVVRASQLGIPCLLGSATPSLESLANAELGRYRKLVLPERVTRHSLPLIEIVDRRNEDPQHSSGERLFSERLLFLLKRTLERREQALLFLNRRGFSRNIHCPRCGYALRCPHCEIGLTYHKQQGCSLCHYCGVMRPVPEQCPDCDFPGIRSSFPGTERIEETLARLFPGVAIGRLDRDTARSQTRMVEILRRFRSGETRILVGTQMVAKGHDIPGVTLVGVLDADIALNLPDFRAAERTAQLLCQVAGRAGRGEQPGRVVIQTRQPEHYAIEAGRRQDLEYLYRTEAPSRRLLRYPPFGYLVRILCEDPEEERAHFTMRQIRETLDVARSPDLVILGPAPAPLARLRGRYRYHLILKSLQRRSLHDLAEPIAWESYGGATRVMVDVDPQSLL
ncbi:MAG: primosomal protein N', partial [Planctomycetota bacterium]